MSDRSADPARRWGLLVTAIVVPLLTAALCVTLTILALQRQDRQNREAQKRLQNTQCALITALDDNFTDLPPPTELGRRNAATMSQLRTALGCDPPT